MKKNLRNISIILTIILIFQNFYVFAITNAEFKESVPQVVNQASPIAKRGLKFGMSSLADNNNTNPVATTGSAITTGKVSEDANFDTNRYNSMAYSSVSDNSINHFSTNFITNGDFELDRLTPYSWSTLGSGSFSLDSIGKSGANSGKISNSSHINLSSLWCF